MSTNNFGSGTMQDDPLQAALLEAESLMESLGGIGDNDITNIHAAADTGSGGSFAIDSDDEEETTGINKSNDTALHPLHEAFLIVPSPSDTNNNYSTASMTSSSATTAAAAGGVPTINNTHHQYHTGTHPGVGVASLVHPVVGQQQQQQAPFTQYPVQQQQQPPQVSPFPSSATSIPSFFGSNGIEATTTSSNMYGGTSDTVSSSSSSPSLDVLIKTSTSRFASNLANMAQRAANQVTTAVVTASSAATPTTSVSGGGGGAGYLPQQQQQQHFFAQQPQYHTMNYTSPTNHTAGNFHQQQVGPELDDEQKKILIQSHVGKLISGERIIMFLQNIQHISDSTGLQYNNHHHNNNIRADSVLWCCAITCYRVLLFSTHPIVPIYKPHDWNISCWPVPPGYNSNSDIHSKQQQSSSCMILQIPLSNIDKIEKTVFTATTTSTGFGSMNVGTSTPVSNISSNTTMNVPSNHPNMNGNSNTLSTTTIMGLIIHDKLNGRQIRFTTMNYSDTNKVYEVLHTYSFPGRRNLGYLFAFESKREEVIASIKPDEITGNQQITLSPTEKRFDAMKEFQRQFTNASMVLDQGPWTIWNTINSSYQLCASYPSILVGPISLDERLNPDKTRLVAHCASFRSEQRLPALTWCGYGGSSIWRCSQPKVGLQGNRSAADEQYFKHIIECAAASRSMIMSNSHTIQQHQLPPRSVLIQLVGTTDLSNWMPNNVGLKILDLRPRSSAMANRTGGYGYENTSHYIGCSIQFCNIGNIHAVRDSYQKVSQLCLSANASDLHFVQQVEDTKWLSHIRVIWAAAWETAYWVHVHKLPVLVHCSHGWDRTSQVVTLSQLLLDPYYRTMSGFACLIEKDFMSFGHPFHLRCGHGEGRDGASNTSLANNNNNGGNNPAIDEGQISPIFLQFLDCVYQVVRLYPEAFEFNTKYLLLLSEHIYSGRFGNFLCDTEREREAVAGIRQRTYSIWDYLENDRSDVYNPQYSPNTLGAGVLLMPVATLLRNIVLWTDRHCMYSPKPTMRWLPPTIHRVVHPLNNDQPSDLITEQETYQLLYSLPKQEKSLVHSIANTAPVSSTKDESDPSDTTIIIEDESSTTPTEEPASTLTANEMSSSS